MIALIDYGVGNLYSVAKALAAVGGDVVITSDAQDLEQADKLVLPGVGAFGDCMKNLEATNLIPTILEQAATRKPLLGICVGLQILFESSEESPDVKGLGQGRSQKNSRRRFETSAHWLELNQNRQEKFFGEIFRAQTHQRLGR